MFKIFSDNLCNDVANNKINVQRSFLYTCVYSDINKGHTSKNRSESYCLSDRFTSVNRSIKTIPSRYKLRFSKSN